ncbi:MAG: hypothetical protein ACAI38_11805 [Myxococcota bacterium]
MTRAIAGLRFAPAEHIQPAEASAKQRLQAAQTVTQINRDVSVRATDHSNKVAQWTARNGRAAIAARSTLAALTQPSSYV